MKKFVFSKVIILLFLFGFITGCTADINKISIPKEFEMSLKLNKISKKLIENVKKKGYADVIIEYNVSSIKTEVEKIKKEKGIRYDDKDIRILKRKAYNDIKHKIIINTRINQKDIIYESENLPYYIMHISNLQTLLDILQNRLVKSIFEDRFIPVAILDPTLSLIGQIEVQNQGIIGSGTAVAILDDYIDVTNSDLTQCVGSGIEECCNVVIQHIIEASNCSVSDHGTDVAQIIAKVAPGANIVGVDVVEETQNWLTDEIQCGSYSSSLIQELIGLSIIVMNIIL
jgi:hypothetical protein